MANIIISCASLSSGGAERVLSILSKPLCDRFGNVTYILWLDLPVFYQVDGRVKIISIAKEIGSNNELKRMLCFRRLVKRENPDLILSFLEPWNIRVLLSAIGLNTRIIVAERNDPRSVNKYWIVNKLEKMVYHLADKILVQTETIREFFNGSLANRTDIIYNPVNLTEELVGKALTTPKKKRIVSVARLTPQKRHDMLIRSFAKFSKMHPDYILTIYGDGPQRQELQQLTVMLGIEDKVEMPGVVKTIHNDIMDAEMFCLVSIREGMSNSMIEAMCLGLPCICTKVSGAIDLIESNVNGILIDIDDEKALYEQMCRVADDKEYAVRLGEEAMQIYNMLRADSIAEQWTEYMAGLIQGEA